MLLMTFLHEGLCQDWLLPKCWSSYAFWLGCFTNYKNLCISINSVSFNKNAYLTGLTKDVYKVFMCEYYMGCKHNIMYSVQ